MKNSSFASSDKKAYRFNGLYRWYHFIVGGAALVGSIFLLRELLILSIPVALFSAFMIARPLTSAVIVDQYSVTLKQMFSVRSVQRSSITTIKKVNTGRGVLLTLRGSSEELAIPVNLFAFDQAWDDWLRTYRDLSSDKPLSLF